MRIGWDVDGVLYNFGDSVHRYLEHTGQADLWKSGPNPEPYWNFYKDWGWTGQQFLDLCNDGADAGFVFCGPTRPGAVEAVNDVKRMGHQIIIITDRAFGSTPLVSQIHTREWLADHGFKYDELHFSADKTIVHTDMFIEDKAENFEALLRVGTDVYLLTRPWNKHIKTDKRISTLQDYVKLVSHQTALRQS